MSNKRLFCLGFLEISVKKSVIELHIKSKKHVRGKEQLVMKEKRERDIAKARKKWVIKKKICRPNMGIKE